MSDGGIMDALKRRMQFWIDPKPSADPMKLATKIAEETIRPTMYLGIEQAIGLYVGEDWKAIIPCGKIAIQDYNSLVGDIREVVRAAIFRALCLVEPSGSISSSELVVNGVENPNTLENSNGFER